MLHPNMGSPRDAATLGDIGSAFPATQGLPRQSIFLTYDKAAVFFLSPFHVISACNHQLVKSPCFVTQSQL